MAAAFSYREMARECVLEAARSKDDDRKRALTGIAKLYTRTALAIEAAAASPLPQDNEVPSQSRRA
jgi:hypothetical protein